MQWKMGALIAWAKLPSAIHQNIRKLLLAMSNLRSHTPFFTSYFTSTFACSLGTHLVHSPVFKAESGQPLSIEDKC